MSNLSITTYCNRKCSYCFAGDSSVLHNKTLNMNMQIFDKALNYLTKSGINQVRLLGGEPTTHPEIITMIEKAIKKGFSILIFSNGLMPQRVLDFLKSLNQKELTILLNTVHPIENYLSVQKKQQRVMKFLGRRVMLGINIFSRQQTFDFLLDYIDDYDLIREIRLGIAHPLIELKNDYLHPKFYKEIGLNIIDLLILARKRNIKLGFDCGFVPCMFPEDSYEMLGDLLKKTGIQCNPIIDLLPDGKFISCYPLNNIKSIELKEGLHAKNLFSDFKNELNIYSEMGIYPYCSKCSIFKKGLCSGGCKAMKIKRLSKII